MRTFLRGWRFSSTFDKFKACVEKINLIKFKHKTLILARYIHLICIFTGKKLKYVFCLFNGDTGFS